MNWISFVADLIGILSAFFALFAWLNTIRIQKFQKKELERLSQKVKIRLTYKINGRKSYIELPGEMRREEVSRAEILGWIGMLPMIKEKERERYKIAYINSPEFFNQMNQIQAGSGDMLFEIPCDKNEIDQFNVVQKEWSE